MKLSSSGHGIASWISFVNRFWNYLIIRNWLNQIENHKQWKSLYTDLRQHVHKMWHVLTKNLVHNYISSHTCIWNVKASQPKFFSYDIANLLPKRMDIFYQEGIIRMKKLTNYCSIAPESNSFISYSYQSLLT